MLFGIYKLLKVTSSAMQICSSQKNRLPSVFADYFVLNITVRSHVTRGNKDLHITTVNKHYGQKKS